jgi:hypothetical protein
VTWVRNIVEAGGCWIGVSIVTAFLVSRILRRTRR